MNVIFSRSLWWVESRKKRRIHIENWFYDNIIGKPSDCQQKKTTIVRTKSQLFFRGESLCKDERRLKTLVSFHFPCGHLSSLLPIRPMCYGSQDHPQSDPVSMYRFLRDCIFNFEKKDRSSQRFSWSIVADDTIISPPSSLYENLIIACCCSA